MCSWCVVFYDEETDLRSYWYGTHEECIARAADPIEPADCDWVR